MSIFPLLYFSRHDSSVVAVGAPRGKLPTVKFFFSTAFLNLSRKPLIQNRREIENGKIVDEDCETLPAESSAVDNFVDFVAHGLRSL